METIMHLLYATGTTEGYFLFAVLLVHQCRCSSVNDHYAIYSQ